MCSRTREDTVRQIVAGLTGDAEGCTDLASELSRGDPVTLEMQDSDEEGNDPEDWTPDPTDAVPGQTHRKCYFSCLFDFDSILDLTDFFFFSR